MTYLLGNDAQEAARRAVALQDALEARIAPLWRNETERAMRLMLEEYRTTGSAPKPVDDHAARMAEIWGTMAQIAVAAFGGRIVDHGFKFHTPYTWDGGKTVAFARGTGQQFDTKSFGDFFARLAAEYVQREAIRRRIALVSDTTRRQIITLIEAGQRSGSTIAEIAKNISDAIAGIAANRSAIIARTEIHGAANYGSHEAARATGLELEKEWVSVADFRTRAILRDDEFDHVGMNGVRVDMDQPFMVPKEDGTLEALQFCGDPEGSAGNIINCRCQTIHAVKGLDD